MNANRQWVAMLTEDKDDYNYWQHGFDSWASHLQLEWFATGNSFFTRVELFQNKPTALLLDGLMPRGEEPVWLERIFAHECCKGVNVIVLSDVFSDDEQQTYLSMGAMECMVFPTDLRALEQAVRRVRFYTDPVTGLLM